MRTKPTVTFEFSRDPNERYASFVFFPTVGGGWRAVLFNGQNNPIDEWLLPPRKGCSPSLALVERLIRARRKADA